MKHSQTALLLYRFLKEIGVHVTPGKLSAELSSHPNSGSLLALSDVMNTIRVRTGAFALQVDELDEVECPFIAHLSEPGDEFAIIKEVNADHIVVSNGKRKSRAIPRESFKRLYNGTILLGEAGENAGDPDYRLNKTRELINSIASPILIALILLLSSGIIIDKYLHAQTASAHLIVLALIKSIGLGLSVLLLGYSVKITNPFIQRLCKSGNNRDCSAILSSKASKITENFSWSELGFFYFAATWLVLLFYGNNPPIIELLALLNLVSLPYTIFSIYYQYRIAKQWCILCCGIQAVLWLEFFCLVPNLDFPVILPSFGSWPSLILICLTPVTGWLIIKKLILQTQKIESLQNGLNVFKNNQGLFEGVLHSQTCYGNPDECFAFTLGNPNAGKVITVVSNPFCPPCSVTHKILDHWLDEKDDMQLRIVYSVKPDERGLKAEFVSTLAILVENKPDDLREALHTWYNADDKDIEAWKKKFQATGWSAKDEELFKKHSEWCENSNIEFTPTVFINGYKLPDLYRLEDIKYLI